MNVLTRNKQTCVDLREQAEKLFTALEHKRLEKADLYKELETILAQCTEANKFKVGMKLLQTFVAQCERAKRVVVSDFGNATETFFKTKSWFDDHGASKRLMDQLTKGINRFIKQARAAKSLNDRVTAYAEMRAVVVKVQAEFFIEAKVAKTTKFVGRPQPLKNSDVNLLRRAS